MPNHDKGDFFRGSLLFPEALPEVSESDIKAELSKVKEINTSVSNDDEIQDEEARFGRRMKIRKIVRQLIAKK